MYQKNYTPYALCNYTTGVREYGLARALEGENIWEIPKEYFMTDTQIASEDYYRVYLSSSLHGLALKIGSIEQKMGQYTKYTPKNYGGQYD
jgi:hypothetical protein